MAASHTQHAELAKRYARALFDLAVAAEGAPSKHSKTAEAVAADLARLAEIFSTHPDVRRLLLTPAVSPEQKQSAWAALGKEIGAQTLTLQFLNLLGHNHRLGLLPAAADAFKSMWLDKNGQVEAVAVTASPLSPAEMKKVKARLEKATGKEVLLENETDAAILGGLVVRMGSVMIDQSVRHRLTRLKTHIATETATDARNINSLAA